MEHRPGRRAGLHLQPVAQRRRGPAPRRPIRAPRCGCWRVVAVAARLVRPGAPGGRRRRRDDRLRPDRHPRLPDQPDHLGAPPGLGRAGAHAAAGQRPPVARRRRRAVLLALHDLLVRAALQPSRLGVPREVGQPARLAPRNTYVWISMALLVALPIRSAPAASRRRRRNPSRPRTTSGTAQPEELDREIAGLIEGERAVGARPLTFVRDGATPSPSRRPDASRWPPRASPTPARPACRTGATSAG